MEPAEVLPPGAFVTELAEWAGAKFQATNQEQTDAIVKALHPKCPCCHKSAENDHEPECHSERFHEWNPRVV